jgi:hypothetical protein
MSWQIKPQVPYQGPYGVRDPFTGHFAYLSKMIRDVMPPLGTNILEEPVAFIFHMKDVNMLRPNMLISYVRMTWFNCDWILLGVVRKDKPYVTSTF